MTLGNSGRITADTDNEFFCSTCGARCTRSSHDGTEFGHLVGCPHRPDEFTIGSKDGRRYRGPEDEIEGDDGSASA